MKIVLIIIAVVVLGVCSIIVCEKVLHRQVREIKTNEVYMGNSIISAPSRRENRYYVELRENGTYSLLYDRTRDEEDETCMLSFVTGTYEKKADVYILKPEKGGMVRLSGLDDSVLEIVRAEGDELFQDTHGWSFLVYTGIYKKDGSIVLAVPKENNPEEYYEEGDIDILYYADKNDLPNTVDEFLREYEELQKEQEQ